MSKPLVLVIEDYQALCQIFSRVLQKDFEVEVCSDGQLALNRLTQITPELIILDLHIPHVSGKEILRRIRTNERLSGTRVLIVTADIIMAETLKTQVDGLLIKPISIKQLSDKVNDLFLRPATH